MLFPGLGQVQIKLGDFRSALSNFEKVLEVYPDNCETLKVSSRILIFHPFYIISFQYAVIRGARLENIIRGNDFLFGEINLDSIPHGTIIANFMVIYMFVYSSRSSTNLFPQICQENNKQECFCKNSQFSTKWLLINHTLNIVNYLRC